MSFNLSQICTELSSVPIKMSHSFFAAGSAVNLLFHPQNPALFPGFGFLSGIFYEYYSFLKIFISSHFQCYFQFFGSEMFIFQNLLYSQIFQLQKSFIARSGQKLIIHRSCQRLLKSQDDPESPKILQISLEKNPS